MEKQFEVQQKITLISNEYRILDPNSRNVIAYLKQKRLALKEQFTLYNNEQQSEIIATSQARKVIDLASAYDVFNGNKRLLAVIKKDFASSLLSSTWGVYADPEMNKLLFRVKESNLAVALLRRLWEFLPAVDLIPLPLKFHFSIIEEGKEVGVYKKLTLLRDQYELQLNKTAADKLDKKAWMVLAVLLDAMQSR